MFCCVNVSLYEDNVTNILKKGFSHFTAFSVLMCPSTKLKYN